MFNERATDSSLFRQLTGNLRAHCEKRWKLRNGHKVQTENRISITIPAIIEKTLDSHYIPHINNILYNRYQHLTAGHICDEYKSFMFGNLNPTRQPQFLPLSCSSDTAPPFSFPYLPDFWWEKIPSSSICYRSGLGTEWYNICTLMYWHYLWNYLGQSLKLSNFPVTIWILIDMEYIRSVIHKMPLHVCFWMVPMKATKKSTTFKLLRLLRSSIKSGRIKTLARGLPSQPTAKSPSGSPLSPPKKPKRHFEFVNSQLFTLLPWLSLSLSLSDFQASPTFNSSQLMNKWGNKSFIARQLPNRTASCFRYSSKLRDKLYSKEDEGKQHWGKCTPFP